MHKKNIITDGAALTAESKVLILMHGRGASAEDILSLATHLNVEGFTLLAPQATNGTWYPYSFLAPPAQNQPWLDSALENLLSLVAEVKQQGVPATNIFFAGFSQGACLTLEFVTRNAERFGGVVAFTGGLIGDRIYGENYRGDFGGTPLFIGSSNPDPHVPVSRVRETEAILQKMNANLLVKIYDGMGHTINQDELNQANQHVFAQIQQTK